MLFNPLIYYFILIFELVDVESQVCLDTIIRRNQIPEISTVRTDRLRMNVIYLRDNYIPKNRMFGARVCCKGYAKENGALEVSIETCKPLCSSNCTNGYCKHPEECACNAGYTQLNGSCVPYCEEDCLHGACVAPGTCRCDSGYYLVNGTCQPVCTTPCVNGICVSPDKCQCRPGYRKSNFDNYACEPICSGGCIYGICEAPEICVCYTGWRKTKDKNDEICSPICKFPCGNGSCVFPNVCSCFLGYKNSMLRNRAGANGPVCKPICKGCSGICVAPNKCEIEFSSTSTAYEETTRTNIAVTLASAERYYNNMEYTSTTTKSYFTLSSNATEIAVKSENSNVTLDKAKQNSRAREREIILIPIMVIITIGIIVFLIWQRIPMKIINFFKGKSYNTQDARRNINNSFENTQFLSELEART